MDQRGVPLGNLIHVRAVALDKAGDPVPVARYPLIFHLRPLELQRAEIQQPVRGAMLPRGMHFTPTAWAQPATASRDVIEGRSPDSHWNFARCSSRSKARIHQGESIFYFSFTSSDPGLFSMSLEVPLIGSVGKENPWGLWGQLVKPEGFEIWARKTELLANKKIKRTSISYRSAPSGETMTPNWFRHAGAPKSLRLRSQRHWGHCLKTA